MVARKPASSISRGEIRNAAHRVGQKSRRAQRAFIDGELATLARSQQQADLQRSGSAVERRLRAEFLRRFGSDTAEWERLGAEVEADYRSKFDAAREIWATPLPIGDILRPDPAPNPPPPAADGEFWWASTDWHVDRGIQAVFLTDGLHFFGFAAYDDDPLISFSSGAVAHFELQARRRPASASGRWASLPAIDLTGKIEGFTGYWHWLWAADDKWAKCWLHLRQTAYQLVPHDFGAPGARNIEVPMVLAERVERRTLIDEENNGNFVNALLPGFTPMPAVEFGLVRPDLSVWVDLEVRFDMQLEGWSHLAFSPEPNPMGSVVLRHPQWRIQAL
jgi:hypothetical protein